jgi:hypothetical protein
MGGFDRRNARHMCAKRMAKLFFKRYGIELVEAGIEAEPALAELLLDRDDPESMMARWRPDAVAVNPAILSARSLLVEIKSKNNEMVCYTVEADALAAARWQLERGHAVVMLFVNIQTGRMLAGWLNEYCGPREVRVPQCRDWKKTVRRMKRQFESANIRVEPYDALKDGSGTAYVLIPCTAKWLRPAREFMEEEILLTREPRRDQPGLF